MGMGEMIMAGAVQEGLCAVGTLRRNLCGGLEGRGMTARSGSFLGL